MNIRVHLNLRRGDWSLTYKGKVFEHAAQVALANVSFKVSEASRLRVVAKHCREVHAWSIGDRLDSMPHGELVEITYNPFRCGAFVRRDNGAEITSADYAVFLPGKRAFAINPR